MGNYYGKLQNDEEALAWTQRAAAQGEPEAEYNLGLAHEFANSVCSLIHARRRDFIKRRPKKTTTKPGKD